MAGEARDEDTTIPKAIKRVMFAVFAIYFTLPLIALSALPVECGPEGCATLLGVPAEEGGYATDPIVGIVRGMDLGGLQEAAEVYVAVLAVTILVAATNAGVLGVSRLVYSMGLHRQLPDRVRQLHPHYQTPYVGIIVFAGVAIIAILPGQAEFLGSIYAFGAMLSFSMAHLAVIRLRRSQPEQRRPYRSPGGVRIRGTTYPPFAIIGVVGTGLSFVVVSTLDPIVAVAGFTWLALGVLIFVWYRRRQGLDLTSTFVVATPQPVVDHEAEYESILVAFDPGNYQAGVVATAEKLAARRRRGIHVSSRSSCRASTPSTPRCPTRSWPRRRSSSRPSSRAAGGSPATGRRSARGRPGGSSSTRRGRCAPPRSSCRSRRAAGAPCSARRSRPCSPSAPAG